ncbi:MAG: transglutaminase family protein [Ilumatobacteraceae bacterium]
MEIDPAWLTPTWFIDSESSAVREFVDRVLGSETGDERATAVRLFHAVRDGIRYDPYSCLPDPALYRASTVLESTSNWCVPKAVALTACWRAAGLPARLGFADVKNHLTSAKLGERMGTDVFYWHGYSEVLLGERWFKVSSAFNIELCERFGTRVLEFDGTADALMHPYDTAGHRHMEYVNQRGSFDDLPLQQIFDDFAELYPSFAFPDSPGDAASHGDDAFA